MGASGTPARRNSGNARSRVASPKPHNSSSDSKHARYNTGNFNGSNIQCSKYDAGTDCQFSGSTTMRKQTRPIGEFGGNLGCLFWTIYIPMQIWYFYGINVLGKGELLVPNAKFWYDLYYTLPEGIAIRPTWEAMCMITLWCVVQALGELFLPSSFPMHFGERDGVPQKQGHKLRYQMNGMLSFVLTHVGFFVLCYFGAPNPLYYLVAGLPRGSGNALLSGCFDLMGLKSSNPLLVNSLLTKSWLFLDPAYIWSQMGALLTGGVITAFVFAVYLYIDFGLLWRNHTMDPEFEEDWGVFAVKEIFNDFFMGVARNPRVFHKPMRLLSKVHAKIAGKPDDDPDCQWLPLDLKRWWDGRTLTLWVILNISYVAAQYYGCSFGFEYNSDSSYPSLITAQPSCAHWNPATSSLSVGSFAGMNVTAGTYFGEYLPGVGSWSSVGYASIFITLAHWYYVFDYNLVEPAYLTTTDIRHDLFGFMLTYGMFGFLCWYYPLAFLGFLSAQSNDIKINSSSVGPAFGSNLTGDNGFITDNYMHTIIGFALYIIGMCFFRYTNIEKHNFRTFIAGLRDEKDADTGKRKYTDIQIDQLLDTEYKIWPQSIQIPVVNVFIPVWSKVNDGRVDYIRTEEGSYLLCGGTWGLARHFNYIGDMVMCVGWAWSCYSCKHAFPLVPISYCAYFWVMDIHRLFRDEGRCAIKYKKDWERYCEKVPWRIVPGVF